MFSHLKGKTKIIVTGCQRSGTRIASKIISQNLDLPYIDEEEYGIHSEENLFQLISSRSRFVIHSPNWVSMRLIPFAQFDHDIHIVYMVRKTKEIIRSMDRINWWRHAPTVLTRLGILGIEPWHKYAIPMLIQTRWEREIRPTLNLDGFTEVDYSTLAEHPLWVNPEERKDFKWNQTEKEEPVPTEETTS